MSSAMVSQVGVVFPQAVRAALWRAASPLIHLAGDCPAQIAQRLLAYVKQGLHPAAVHCCKLSGFRWGLRFRSCRNGLSVSWKFLHFLCKAWAERR